MLQIKFSLISLLPILTLVMIPRSLEAKKVELIAIGPDNEKKVFVVTKEETALSVRPERLDCYYNYDSKDTKAKLVCFDIKSRQRYSFSIMCPEGALGISEMTISEIDPKKKGKAGFYFNTFHYMLACNPDKFKE